ncbi:MAG: ATP-binding protein [Deltaproteobacteria bacterium]
MSEALSFALVEYLDRLADPILALCGDRFAYANPAFFEKTGNRKEEFIGRRVPDVIATHARISDVDRRWMQSAHETRTGQGIAAPPRHFEIERPDGSIYHCLSTNPIAIEGHLVFSLVDASADAQLAQVTARLTQSAVSLGMIHDVGLICQAAVDAIGSEGMTAALFLFEGAELVLRAVASEPERVAKAEANFGRRAIGRVFSEAAYPAMYERARSKRMHFAHDFRERTRLHPEIPSSPNDGHAHATIPLIARGEACGCIHLSGVGFSPGLAGAFELYCGHVSVALENARLVAELRAVREQAVQHERLAAVGEAAAVLAHELRNSLAVLYNGLAMLRLGTPSSGKTLASMQEEAERLNQLVADLLDFSRPLTPQPSAIETDELVAEAIAIARRGLGLPELEVAVDLTLAPRELSADGPLLGRAIANLLVNASQASPTGTGIGISAERRGSELVVMVEDRGKGISDDSLPKLFKPFFTTKPQGTGLGLTLVQKIANAHGGRATAENRDGGGARFSLFLPAP